jgi:hypothetical protein
MYAKIISPGPESASPEPACMCLGEIPAAGAGCSLGVTPAGGSCLFGRGG